MSVPVFACRLTFIYLFLFTYSSRNISVWAPCRNLLMDLNTIVTQLQTWCDTWQFDFFLCTVCCLLHISRDHHNCRWHRQQWHNENNNYLHNKNNACGDNYEHYSIVNSIRYFARLVYRKTYYVRYTRIQNIRPDCSTTYVDVEYCYRPSRVVCRSVVCRSVCHTSQPCKNGFTDRDAVRVEDSRGRKEPLIRWSPGPPCEGAILRGKGAYHYKV